MPFPRRAVAVLLPCVALLLAGCATTPEATHAIDADTSLSGSIVSIDTQPWTYDGNAVVLVDTHERGRVAVQLPARWNLCKAPAVEVEALRAGMQVRVVGRAGAEGDVVVCQDAVHRLVPLQ